MHAHALVAGEAKGETLVLGEPLSFWGGVDPLNGLIIDRRHPRHGECITGRVLVMPAGRGSSSSTTVLAEAIRLETGPAAILLAHDDIIIVVGALAAADLYGRVVPVMRLTPDDLATIPDGVRLSVSADSVAIDR
jgi:predicted aconitase with swiveling domain